MNKELPGLEPCKRIGWNATVGTADPEEFWALSLGLGGKDAGIAGLAIGGPSLVVIEELLDGWIHSVVSKSYIRSSG